MDTGTAPEAPPTDQGTLPLPAPLGSAPERSRTVLSPASATPSPADRLTVRAWWDPDLATRGHDPRSLYAERFWLPVVGPSTLLLLRRLARGLELHPAGFRICPADTARALGLGTGGGRQGPLNRTIDRACTFGLARREDPCTLMVRTHLPTLNRRQISHLPQVLQTAHADWRRVEATRRSAGPSKD